jgi:hypothetical protein
LENVFSSLYYVETHRLEAVRESYMDEKRLIGGINCMAEAHGRLSTIIQIDMGCPGLTAVCDKCTGGAYQSLFGSPKKSRLICQFFRIEDFSNGSLWSQYINK